MERGVLITLDNETRLSELRMLTSLSDATGTRLIFSGTSWLISATLLLLSFRLFRVSNFGMTFYPLLGLDPERGLP